MGKKIPKILTQEEFEKLLQYTIKKKPRNWKNKAIAMLLGFEAGMRISEIVGLELSGVEIIKPLGKEQVNFELNTVKVESGKGQKDRIVPLPKRFRESYLNMLPLKIGRRALQAYITKLGLTVLNKKISFHTLRHGFGSHLAGLKYPLHQIQMLMGHSRLDTTGIYLHANPKEAIKGARELF